MVSPALANFSYRRGDTKPMRFTAEENGSIVGWTVVFTIRKTASQADPPVLSLTGTIEDAGSPTTKGVITATPTLAQSLTLELRPYLYSLKRTNVGAEETLTAGVMTVQSDIYNQVP